MPTHCINFRVGEDDDEGDEGDEGDKGEDGDDSDDGDGGDDGYNMAVIILQKMLPGPTLRWDHSTKITGVAKDKNLARLQWIVIVLKYQFVSWWQCFCWF